MRGIPFFFVRVDDAGNISKRLAAAGMQFATHGGACPKWTVHKAFRTPEKILTQAVELPGGQKFFTLTRTVPPLWSATSESTTEFAVALGCKLHHARDIIYADNMGISANKNSWSQSELAVRRVNAWTAHNAPTHQSVMNCALTAIRNLLDFMILTLTSQKKIA
tara:strand:- start:237 stop:728 length:492 start_codon:yes stop_codon:yes gene_type:complete